MHYENDLNFKVNPWLDTEIPIPQREGTIQLLLEYAVLCDIECWDVRHLLSDLNNIINIENALINSFQSDEKFQPFRARCEAERILLYTQVSQTESGKVNYFDQILRDESKFAIKF